jgi:hypothetical protein
MLAALYRRKPARGRWHGIGIIQYDPAGPLPFKTALKLTPPRAPVAKDIPWRLIHLAWLQVEMVLSRNFVDHVETHPPSVLDTLVFERPVLEHQISAQAQ